MKRHFLLILSLIAFLRASAQDYRIVSVEHLPNDMSAREEIMTDERGRQCALLRIVTKDLTPEQRSGFSLNATLARGW